MSGIKRFAAFAIALVVGVAILILVINEWNIVNGYNQLTANAWTFLGLIFGTGLLVPAVAMMCDALKDRKATEAAARDAANKRDNETKLTIEKARIQAQMRPSDDGKAG